MQSESDNGSSLLSSRLEAFIEEWDQDVEPQPDEEDPKEMSALIERMIRLATSSLEGFSESAAHKLITLWGENPEHWQSAVDEFYSREAVGNIRKSVSRFLKLREVLVGTIPSSEVNVYLREATRCYIHGFFQGSVALCRAALEAGLNELLKRKMGHAPRMDLIAKINQASTFKLLNSVSASEAHEVRKAAGTVLHEKPASQALAFDTVARTRGVLITMYQR